MSELNVLMLVASPIAADLKLDCQINHRVKSLVLLMLSPDLTLISETEDLVPTVRSYAGITLPFN